MWETVIIIICLILLVAVTVFLILSQSPEQEQLELEKLKLAIYQSNLEKYNRDKSLHKISYPIYYINMDKDIKRRKYMEKTLSRISSNFTRIKGVNGKLVKDTKRGEVEGFEYIFDYEVSKNEIGCFLAHIRAIKTMYDRGDNIALICEDDLYVEPYSLSKSLETVVANAPANWCILQLFAGGIKSDINSDISYHVIKKITINRWSASAYLINRKGAEKLFSVLGYPYHIRMLNCYPIGGELDIWAFTVVKTYTVTPFYFGINTNLDSTIHQDHVWKYHLPTMKKFLENIDNYITKNKKKIAVRNRHDINFVNHIYPGYLTHDLLKADIMFDSILNRNTIDYDGKRLVLDWEPFYIDTPLKQADVIITTKKSFDLSYSPKASFIYLPSYSFFFSEYRISPEKLLLPKNIQKKTKFCAFVYSNCDYYFPGVVNRENFFDLMQKRCGGRIDSWGKCKKNMDSDSTDHADNSSLFSEYKFVIAFENDYPEGYITEKITNPMLAGSIPIYLGDKDIGEHFNKKSFINVRDYTTWEECIDYILYLDQNDDAYNNMMKEPWLVDDRLTKHFSWWKPSLGDFYEQLEMKVGKDIVHVD